MAQLLDTDEDFFDVDELAEAVAEVKANGRPALVPDDPIGAVLDHLQAKIAAPAPPLERETREEPDPDLKPAAVKAPGPRWYELEWVMPYQDLVIVGGFFLFVAGVAMIYRPAGVMTAGAGIFAAGWLMARRG